MLAADVLCMAEASVATLVTGHTTFTQSEQSSLVQLFAASARPAGLFGLPSQLAPPSCTVGVV